MESLCGPVLYERIEDGIAITTRSCSQVLYEIGPCDASYLYLNERFYYTIACPIADVVATNKTKNSTGHNKTLSKNTTKNTTKHQTTLLRRVQSNHTFNNSINETIPPNASFYRYPIEGKEATKNETFGPALLIVLIVSAVLLSVLSCAVILLKRKEKTRRRLRKRPSSSIMPQVVRGRTATDEVRQVLNKMVNTICRWNGQRPYRHSAPESAPPIPPRPPKETKRAETLEYLRRTSSVRPHAAIQGALAKPSESFVDSGKRRAELLRREAALVARRDAQPRRKRSRLEKIVRLKELQSKRVGGQKNIG